jgi:predicted aminopeptidase
LTSESRSIDRRQRYGHVRRQQCRYWVFRATQLSMIEWTRTKFCYVVLAFVSYRTTYG